MRSGNTDKAVADYRRAGYREEPYEVLLAAGLKTWRPGTSLGWVQGRQPARPPAAREPVSAGLPAWRPVYLTIGVHEAAELMAIVPE